MNGVTWRHQVLQERQGKPKGLAGAGLCLADYVVPVEGNGKSEFLNGECLGDAQVGQIGHGLCPDAEVCESSQGVRLAG